MVVCDGAKALMLENAGDEKFPNLKTIEVLQQNDPPTHALGTDEAGTAYRFGRQACASAMEQTDWHDQAEREFLVHLAQQLDGVAAGKVQSLIVVAPPRALGMIRPAYSCAERRRAGRDRQGSRKMPVHESKSI